jgi:hypothetical protein
MVDEHPGRLVERGVRAGYGDLGHAWASQRRAHYCEPRGDPECDIAG